MFGGTDRRWHSAERCHPFLAVGRARNGIPLILLDEIEKAATRADYGCLSDALLAFVGPETAARYPDPALRTLLNSSQISLVATANFAGPLPAPIGDRFRIVTFPKPQVENLIVLLPAGWRMSPQNVAWTPAMDRTAE